MSQHRLEPTLAPAGRHARAQAAPRPVSLYDATGGARPTHVARRPATVAHASAAVALAAATVSLLTLDDPWTPLVAAIVAATCAVVAVWAWLWARRPQVVIGHRGMWFAATEDRPEVVHPWSDVLAVYGETRVDRSTPSQVHGVERHLLGVHLRSQVEPEVRVVRRRAVTPLVRLHRVVAAVAPNVPVTRQEPWGTQPGQHPLVVLWRKVARTS
jgi:hypothetical protein